MIKVRAFFTIIFLLHKNYDTGEAILINYYFQSNLSMKGYIYILQLTLIRDRWPISSDFLPLQRTIHQIF